MDRRIIKGIVHMITMLTSIAHILTLEGKKNFKCLETNTVTPFWLILYPQLSMRSQKSCLTIQKKMPNNPKKSAWQSQKLGLTIVQLICTDNRQSFFWDLRSNLEKHAWQLRCIFFGIVRHLFVDCQAFSLGLPGNLFVIWFFFFLLTLCKIKKNYIVLQNQ